MINCVDTSLTKKHKIEEISTEMPNTPSFERQTDLREQLMALKKHFGPFGWNLDKVYEPVPLTLENVKYLIVGRKGSGCEGDIYKLIRNDDQKEMFALKVYNDNAINKVNGDKLIFEKASESRKYLNMPLVVNTPMGYSISPLLGSHFTCEESNFELMRAIVELNKKLNEALEKDGLRLGDNLNAGNFVSTEDGSLKRIDFASASVRTVGTTFRYYADNRDVGFPTILPMQTHMKRKRKYNECEQLKLPDTRKNVKIIENYELRGRKLTATD